MYLWTLTRPQISPLAQLVEEGPEEIPAAILGHREAMPQVEVCV